MANKKYPWEEEAGQPVGPRGGYDKDAPVDNTLDQPGKPPAYQPPSPTAGYTGEPANNAAYAGAQDLLGQINNRGPFTLDFDKDALYNAYKQQYAANGQMAMMDTMGQAAGLTGGYGSTYGQAVGQQQYDRHLTQLNDQALGIYDRARAAYDQEGQDLINRYNLMMQQYGVDYNRWRDEIGDQRYEDELAYNRDRDAVADDRWQQQWDYQTARDQIEDQRWQQQWDYQQQQTTREQSYNMALMMIQSGQMPGDDVLASAGIDKSWAQAMSTWYANQLGGTGGGSGGGGGGGGRTGGTQRPTTDTTPTATTTTTNRRDELWATFSPDEKAQILSWINSHSGNIGMDSIAGLINERWGGNANIVEYLRLIYGV